MDDMPTLEDMLTINGTSLKDYGVSQQILAGSMWKALYAEESSNGKLHEFERELTAPIVGFRKVNEGTANSPDTNELVTVQLELLDATVTVDKGLADIYKHGRDVYMAKKSIKYMKAAFHHSEKQLIYGTAADDDGFLGLVDYDLYKFKDSEKVIDAGGSGNNVQSIWIMRSGEDHVSALYNGDTPFEIGEVTPVKQNAYNESGEVTGDFPALMSDIMSYVGMKIASKHDVMRVCNIDLTSNTIENAIQKALEEFPSDNEPTHIFASRKSRGALRRGRQSFNSAGKPAEQIDEIDGIPVLISESLGMETALGDTP